MRHRFLNLQVYLGSLEHAIVGVEFEHAIVDAIATNQLKIQTGSNNMCLIS